VAAKVATFSLPSITCNDGRVPGAISGIDHIPFIFET
jgi:hypothetical protein